MHLTRKAIAERIKEIDVVIELLDARLPGSSANPMLAEITKGKPALKVLNKQDLADPLRTAAWLAHFNAQPGVRALPLDASGLPHKVIVDAEDTVAARDLAQAGASKLVDYGSFSLWRFPGPSDSSVLARTGITLRDDFDTIALRGSGVDTRAGAPSVPADLRQTRDAKIFTSSVVDELLILYRGIES